MTSTRIHLYIATLEAHSCTSGLLRKRQLAYSTVSGMRCRAINELLQVTFAVLLVSYAGGEDQIGIASSNGIAATIARSHSPSETLVLENRRHAYATLITNREASYVLGAEV